MDGLGAGWSQRSLPSQLWPLKGISVSPLLNRWCRVGNWNLAPAAWRISATLLCWGKARISSQKWGFKGQSASSFFPGYWSCNFSFTSVENTIYTHPRALNRNAGATIPKWSVYHCPISEPWQKCTLLPASFSSHSSMFLVSPLHFQSKTLFFQSPGPNSMGAS